MSTHPEDLAEVEKFRAFLRRAATEPRDSGRTWGDLYDEMYDNGDRAEDTEAGLANDSGTSFYTDSGV